MNKTSFIGVFRITENWFLSTVPWLSHVKFNAINQTLHLAISIMHEGAVGKAVRE